MCDSFVMLKLYFRDQDLGQTTIFISPVEKEEGGSRPADCEHQPCLASEWHFVKNKI